jgi:hypothetical protein
MELARALPEVRLYPVRVTPPALRDGAPVAVLRLLAAEYTKWLAASAGLSRLHSGVANSGSMRGGATA